MARLIPMRPRKGANVSEKRIFDALAGAEVADGWIVLHSLEIRRHVAQFQGEADFIVLVPGRGIVVIEAKSPEYVEYKDGEWRLNRVPNPGKSPFDQLDGSIRSLRGFLKHRELLRGDEPIARLVWFTSLGRHQFNNVTPGDMQFFEWELAWRDDLKDPVALIESVLTGHDEWYSKVPDVAHDPTGLTAERVEEIAAALIGDFEGGRTLAERKIERQEDEWSLLKEQSVVLDMLERNDQIYFDGPAGTGKSFLLARFAQRWSEGRNGLVTCWNLLMADELKKLLPRNHGMVVEDFNTLMLRLAGLKENPSDAADTWYTEELPRLALAAVENDPFLGGYDLICVDEVQDIAGFPAVLDLLFALAASPTKFVFAGDARQQILRPAAERVDPFAVVRERVPGVIHVSLKRGLRQVGGLAASAEELLSRRFGYSNHRVTTTIDEPLSIQPVGESASQALTAALRELLKHHQAHDIVVLSPFGDRSSLVGQVLASEHFSKDERWLRGQLRAVSGEGPLPDAETPIPSGRIRWGSIFKYKGLDAEAVVLTDIGDGAMTFVRDRGLDWFDLLYVGLTRARYRCVVIPN